MSLFTKAVKTESKLRMAIAGPSGSGKTYTALEIATGLAGIKDKNGRAPDGSIAVIDTEHGSARKYSDKFNFDVLELESFHHNKYIEAIEDAEKAGYQVLVIDSLSHCWFGKDGAMEQVDRAANKGGQSGNKFTAWAGVTPLQNKLIDTIIASKVHIIATMRAKTEYVMEERNGKSVPRKVGLAPIQREGIDFEFDLYGLLDRANTLTVDKSRCSELAEQIIEKPTRKLSEILLAWLSGEKVEPKATVAQKKDMAHDLKFIFGDDTKSQKAHFERHTGEPDSKNITQSAMATYLERLDLECAVYKQMREQYPSNAADGLKASLMEFTGEISMDELTLDNLRTFQERLEAEAVTA